MVIDYIFKITVLGDVYTGKTTLIDQLKYPSLKSNTEQYLTTVGVEYQTVVMEHMENDEQKNGRNECRNQCSGRERPSRVTSTFHQIEQVESDNQHRNDKHPAPPQQ